jgi:hypothetical protein
VDDDLKLLKLEVLVDVCAEDNTDSDNDDYDDDDNEVLFGRSLEPAYTLHFRSQLASFLPTIRSRNCT